MKPELLIGILISSFAISWFLAVVFWDDGGRNQLDNHSKKYNVSKIFVYFWVILFMIPLWYSLYHILKFLSYTIPNFLFKNTIAFLKSFKVNSNTSQTTTPIDSELLSGPVIQPLIHSTTNNTNTVLHQLLKPDNTRAYIVYDIASNLNILLTDEQLLEYGTYLTQCRHNKIQGIAKPVDFMKIHKIESKHSDVQKNNPPEFEII